MTTRFDDRHEKVQSLLDSRDDSGALVHAVMAVAAELRVSNILLARIYRENLDEVYTAAESERKPMHHNARKGTP